MPYRNSHTAGLIVCHLVISITGDRACHAEQHIEDCEPPADVAEGPEPLDACETMETFRKDIHLSGPHTLHCNRLAPHGGGSSSPCLLALSLTLSTYHASLALALLQR